MPYLFIYSFFYDRLRHGRDKFAEGVWPVDCPVYLATPYCADIGIRPKMLQLNGCHRPVPVYGRRQQVDRRKRRGVVKVDLGKPNHTPFAVRRGRPDIYSRRFFNNLWYPVPGY